VVVVGRWGALGIGGFLLITLMGDTQRRDVAIGLGVAAIAGAIGLVALRWGVAADEHGLTVSNSLRHHRIAWPDLELIALEEVPGEVSVGFYRLVFVVGPRHRRIVADAPTGLPSPGHEVYQLGHDLAAMHKRYSTSR
jgi:hypothetical protein